MIVGIYIQQKYFWMTSFFKSLPSFLTSTFYSNCQQLEVGCCIKLWDGSQYVDADLGRGSSFSDGTFCYTIEDCIVVSKSLCKNYLYVNLCTYYPYADSMGQVDVLAFVTTEYDGGTRVGPNTTVTVNFTVTGSAHSFNGQLTIPPGYILYGAVGYATISGFTPGETITGLAFYGGPLPVGPAISPAQWTSQFPLPNTRYYVPGKICDLGIET